MGLVRLVPSLMMTGMDTFFYTTQDIDVSLLERPVLIFLFGLQRENIQFRASAPASCMVRAKSVHSELLKQLILAMMGMVQRRLVS